MKKFYIILLIAIITPIAVYAWDDCPYGILNDPFPGQCPRYVDTNHNNICDHSESPNSSSINTSSNTEETSQKRRRHGNNINNTTNEKQNANTSFSDINKANPIPNENYNLIPLTISAILFYLLTYLLYLEKRLTRKNYYRIWNYVLTVSFLVTGVTGLVMIILINYGIQSTWNLTIDFWHAEFAIIMAFTTIFHIHMYWKPFKMIFKL